MTGTGSPIPDPERSGPSQLVIAGERKFLIDCGRGCLMRLAAVGAAPSLIEKLLITHLHSDHITDVNDLITTNWITGFPPTPLSIAGPEGTKSFIDDTLSMLAKDIRYRVEHHDDLNSPPAVEVSEVSAGVIFEDDEIRITAAPTEHKPAHPSVGYKFETSEGSLVLAGDTVPCDALDELCIGADVYVQTVVRDDLIKQMPIPRLLDVLSYHSTVADAGNTASKAGVKKLVLNHCVPAPGNSSEINDWIEIAAKYFDGEIILPSDLQVIHVG